MIPLALMVLTALAPTVVNGRIETHTASGDLGRQIMSFDAPAWVGYKIAAVPQRYRQDCDESHGKTAFLEGEREAFVLIRTSEQRTRILSTLCEIDLGGLPLHWIEGVSAAASIAFLMSLNPPAISSIGAHADRMADDFLYKTAASVAAKRHERSSAARWLASSRGARGLEFVNKLAASDPDDELRADLMSAIGQAPDFGGTAFLIDYAVHDKVRKVREKAMFWLGHSKDPKAVRFIDDVLKR